MEEQLVEVKKQQAQIAKDKVVELSKKHPDYRDLTDDDDLQLDSGQPIYKTLLITYDAKEISRVIDLYKYDRGISSKKVTNADVKKKQQKQFLKQSIRNT